MFKYDKHISFADNTSHGEIVKLISKGERVLEFGCAKGELSGYLREKLGCYVFGIEISAEALECAKSSLDGYFCCDLESNEWESAIEGMSFDVLVCADVLEHLRDPAAILKRALPFLKDDGKIIFSIPNISYADVVLKLLYNRFDYTDIGLLDNTHIHFFAKENLVDFCDDAGVFPALISGTTNPIGTSEQRMSGQVDAVYRRAVSAKEYADVYQFVVYAFKKEWAKSADIKTQWNLRKNLLKEVKLYYGADNNFNEEHTKSFTSEDGLYDICFRLPEGARFIRFDMSEGIGTLLAEYEIVADGVPLTEFQSKGIVKLSDGLLSVDADPYLVYELPEKTEEIRIKANLSDLFTSDKSCERIMREVEKLNFECCELVAQNNAYKDNISGLEATLCNKETELAGKERELLAQAEEITGLKERNERILVASAEKDEKINYLNIHYTTAISQREDLKRQLADVENKYNVVINSQFWKITKPFRVFLDFIKKIIRKVNILPLIKKFFVLWKEEGFKRAVKKVFNRRKNAEKARKVLYTKKQLEAQRKQKFSKDVKFSILVPLYNTPENFLVEMIQSVVAQTYSNWELCLADGSDDKHKYVGHVCRKMAKQDKRIVYKKLEKNLGISGNTNACIDMATGDYISLFDHDDLLHPAALHDVMVEICEKDADFIYTDENTFHRTPDDAYCPHFKPDFAPDTLRSYNYICHFTSFKASLIDEVGKFRSEFDGSQDYDMILRLTEKANKIVHIPKILYYWRSHANSVASDISAKPYTLTAAKKALDEHLVRVGLKGKATDARIPSTYKIEYEIEGEPLVSIIIPNKDHTDDLDKCISSVEKISTYKNYEIIVVENNSEEQETFEYYEEVQRRFSNVKVVEWKEKGFNYPKINNFGFEMASGEYIILMNNDIEPLTPAWIEEMLMYSQREDVGAVGMMLYYPDDTIQHAGVVIGIGGDPEMAVAGHSHKYFRRGEYGYASRLAIAQNYSAVTAACLMVRSDVYKEVGGLDESFAVAFNDVDFCLKIRSAGYLIVWTPFAEAYHYESKSRGLENTPEKVARFNREINTFLGKWRKVRDAGDPYYNPNLTLEHENFNLR